MTLSGLSMKCPPRERTSRGGAGKFGSSVQKKSSKRRRSSSLVEASLDDLAAPRLDAQPHRLEIEWVARARAPRRASASRNCPSSPIAARPGRSARSAAPARIRGRARSGWPARDRRSLERLGAEPLDRIAIDALDRAPSVPPPAWRRCARAIDRRTRADGERQLAAEIGVQSRLRPPGRGRLPSEGGTLTRKSLTSVEGSSIVSSIASERRSTPCAICLQRERAIAEEQRAPLEQRGAEDGRARAVEAERRRCAAAAPSPRPAPRRERPAADATAGAARSPRR